MLGLKKILVVHEDKKEGLKITRKIKNIGYFSIGLLKNFEETKNTVELKFPDLILVDLNPNTEQNKLIELFKNLGINFKIPIVFLTPNLNQKNNEKVRWGNPFNSINKPIKTGELRVFLEMAFSFYKNEKYLSEQDHWLNSVLNSIGDALITTDLGGYITYINSMAEILSGWSKENALGKDVLEFFRFFDESSQSMESFSIQNFLEEDGTMFYSNNFFLISKYGEQIEIEAYASQINQSSNEILGVSMVFRPINLREKEDLNNFLLD